MVKVAVLIDGGHVRACAKLCGKTYDNVLIEAFAKNCVAPDEYLFRVFELLPENRTVTEATI